MWTGTRPDKEGRTRSCSRLASPWRLSPPRRGSPALVDLERWAPAGWRTRCWCWCLLQREGPSQTGPAKVTKGSWASSRPRGASTGSTGIVHRLLKCSDPIRTSSSIQSCFGGRSSTGGYLDGCMVPGTAEGLHWSGWPAFSSDDTPGVVRPCHTRVNTGTCCCLVLRSNPRSGFGASRAH